MLYKRSKSSSSQDSIFPTCAIPALLIKMSIEPNEAIDEIVFETCC